MRFGLPAALPATVLTRLWTTPQARALFGGVAAHAFSPLNQPMSSSVGMALTTACHAFGWAVARGGSRSITDALAAVLVELGGKIETNARVSSLAELDTAQTIVFDLAPAAVAEIAGDRLPRRIARAYRRYRHGPGRVQGRSRRRGRRAVDQRSLPSRRHRARDRLLRGNRCRRARGQPWPHARTAIRPGRPAVPGRPRALRR